MRFLGITALPVMFVERLHGACIVYPAKWRIDANPLQSKKKRQTSLGSRDEMQPRWENRLSAAPLEGAWGWVMIEGAS